MRRSLLALLLALACGSAQAQMFDTLIYPVGVGSGSGSVPACPSTDANSVCYDSTTGCLVYEGSSADGIELNLCAADPTSADKTITLPNLTGTVALLGAAVKNEGNFWLGDDRVFYMGGGGDADVRFAWRTSLTPDGFLFGVGNDSRSFQLIESADFAYDFNNGPCGTSACTNPTLIIHSANQATGEWVAFYHDGTNGILNSGTGGFSLAVPLLVDNSGSIAFSESSTNGSARPWLTYSTALTPDNLLFGTSTLANSFHVVERQDSGYDFQNGPCGTSACTDPAWIVHSSAQATNQWTSIQHDQTNGVIKTGLGGLLGWRFAVEANTGSKTPSDESQEVYTNTGDADGSSITLPNDPTVGTALRVILTVAQTVTITPSADELLYMDADQCVLNMTASAIGANTLIIAATGGSGAIWVATGHGFTCNDS